MADYRFYPIVDTYRSVRIHRSPPPSLSHLRRAQISMAASAIVASSTTPRQPTRLDLVAAELESRRRSPPMAYRDPQGALMNYIEHLLTPEHADSAPHLLAIGYELEALLSMYPSSVKLCLSSRPSSVDMSRLPSAFADSPLDSAAQIKGDIHIEGHTLSSVAMSARRSSQSWTDAVFDAEYFAPGERIRYEVNLPLWEEGDAVPSMDGTGMMPKPPTMRVLVSLPPTYPNTAPPQLQLLGRYLGAFAIDSGLFGDITRTYITSTGVPFTPGDVCVFEGLTHAQAVARVWYTARLHEGAEGERVREADRRRGKDGRAMSDLPDELVPASPARMKFDAATTSSSTAAVGAPTRPDPRPMFSYTRHPGSGADGTETPMTVHAAEAGEIPHVTIHTSQPIVDRKSKFIGHAIRVTDEREVPLVVHEILSDKRVAKAAHPAMFAYRIAKDVGGAAGRVYVTDCDDDGETAAGSRLAHLLEILELENVLVVVSRWYGGTLLGADRFKHINQAAREALEVGGFLDDRGQSKGRRK